jgi:O-antigen/teichoic acid export membrane protein
LGIIKRQSLKTSLVNYTGIVIGVVFFNFIFPHIINEEYLGLIGLLQNITFILATFPSFGMAYVLLRYFSVWRNEETVNRFNRFAWIVMTIGLFLFFILFYFFNHILIDQYKQQSPLFVPYVYWIVPLVIFYTYTQYLELYAMVKLRIAIPAFLREIANRVLLIILLFAFAYHFISNDLLIYLFVSIYAISAILLFFYSNSVLSFKFSSNYRFWDKKNDLNEPLKYAFNMLLILVTSNLSNFIDGIILPAYLGLGALGIYMRPLVLGQMIQVPYRAISLISIPILREALVNNDLDKVRDLNRSIGLNLFLIGTFLFTGLVVCADGFFALLPPQYAQARYVLYIIGFGRLMDMAFGLNSEILNYSNHYRIIIYLSMVMMAMTISLDVFLIPRWGMNGAASAVTFSLIVFNILKSIFIYKRFKFHCFSRHYLTLLILMLLVIFGLQSIPFVSFIDHHMFYNALLNVLFKGSLSVIGFLIPVFILKVSPDLNHFIGLLLSGKIFRGGHKMEGL